MGGGEGDVHECKERSNRINFKISLSKKTQNFELGKLISHENRTSGRQVF